MLVAIMIGRLAVVLLVTGCLLQSQDWSLSHLFSRPFLWGVSPAELHWSKDAHVLAFTWNEQGHPFRDLYVYRADEKQLRRLTNLENQRDAINESPAEKDRHQKNYLLPQAGISDYDISRDGSKVAFSYKGDLYLSSTTADHRLLRLTRTQTSEAHPHLSPDGKTLAYILSGQLYIQDLQTGFRNQITDIKAPAQLEDYDWSPDGKEFVLNVSPSPGRMMPLPNYSGQFVTAAPFPRDVAGDALAIPQILLIASDGTEPTPRPVTGLTGISPGLPEWSDDSKHLWGITFTRDYKSQQVWIIDRDTATAATVFKDTDPAWAFDMAAGWSPDSRHIWLLSERDGHGHLYTTDINGKNLEQITRGAWDVMEESGISREPQWIGGYLYFSSTEAGTQNRRLYRIPVDKSAGVESLSPAEGIHAGLLTKDGRYRAVMQADSKNPLDLYVNDQRITKSPSAEFYRYTWPAARFVHFPSPKDHKSVAARLLLPPGYDPDNPSQPKRPAIVYIHGAGYATSVLDQWGSYQELRFVFNNYLAHQGYVVIEMDYRGSSGYGRDWRTGVYLNMGGPDLEDVAGAVDYLKTLKNVDTDHVGIWGVSYGGFMTAEAMFRTPDLFKIGAAWSGVYDWENYNSWYTGQRLTTPAENPEAYRRSSPIWFSNGLKNHLLLVHGIVDNNVLFQDAVQLSEKLIHEGKPFEQAFYPEESHGFTRDETLIDAFGRTARLFDQYLKQP